MSTRIARRDRRNHEHGHDWVDMEAVAHHRVVTRARISYEIRTGAYWPRIAAECRKFGEAFIPLAANMHGFADRLKDAVTALSHDKEIADVRAQFTKAREAGDYQEATSE